ncbi:MAG: hypothetical protein IK133_08040 [Clostridia bacterium]|nr:hypothetical protein [Clostridia bacterium]
MDKTEMVRERILRAIEIANTDPDGQKLAHKLNDGKLVVRIRGGLEVPVQACGGQLSIAVDSSHPKAVCEYSDADSAWALLNREMSRFAATVHGQLNQRGLSPMNETFEKILLLANDKLHAAE